MSADSNSWSAHRHIWVHRTHRVLRLWRTRSRTSFACGSAPPSSSPFGTAAILQALPVALLPSIQALKDALLLGMLLLSLHVADLLRPRTHLLRNLLLLLDLHQNVLL